MAKGFYEYESFSYGDPLMERGRPQVYADLSERYGGRRSVHGTPTAEVDDSDPMIARNLRENYAYAMEQGSVAEFAMTRIPEYRMQAANAINSGFYDKAAEIKKTIGDFVSAHYADLSKWTNLRHNGEEGRKISEGVRSVLTGNYLTEWTGAKNVRGETMSLGAFLDQNSEENRQRTIKNQAAETQLPLDVVRAISDENDPYHNVYGRFKSILSQGQRLPQSLAGGSEALPDNTLKNELNTVRQLVGTYGPDREGQPPRQGLRFADVDEMGAFLDMVNSSMSASKVPLGAPAVMKLAGSWLAHAPVNTDPASRLQHMQDYVQRVSNLTNALEARLAPKDEDAASRRDDALKVRSRFHQASVLATQFADAVQRKHPFGADGDLGLPLDSAATADALGKAVEDVNKLEDYGVNIVARPHWADLVTSLAIQRMGGTDVSWHEHGDVLKFTETYVPLLERMRTEVLKARLPDGRTVEGPQSPMAHVEDAIIKAAGKAIFQSTRFNSGDTASPLGFVMPKLVGSTNDMSEHVELGPVGDAIANTLDRMLHIGNGNNDRTLSRTLAEGLCRKMAGLEHRSLQEMVRDATGDFDPETGLPKEIVSTGGDIATAAGFQRAVVDPAGTFALKPFETDVSKPAVTGLAQVSTEDSGNNPLDPLGLRLGEWGESERAHVQTSLARDVRAYAQMRLDEMSGARSSYADPSSADSSELRLKGAQVRGAMAADVFAGHVNPELIKGFRDGSLADMLVWSTGTLDPRDAPGQFVERGVMNLLRATQDPDPVHRWEALAVLAKSFAGIQKNTSDPKTAFVEGNVNALAGELPEAFFSDYQAAFSGVALPIRPFEFMSPIERRKRLIYTIVDNAARSLGLPQLRPDPRSDSQTRSRDYLDAVMASPYAQQSMLVKSGFLTSDLKKAADFDAAYNYLYQSRHVDPSNANASKAPGFDGPDMLTGDALVRQQAREVYQTWFGGNGAINDEVQGIMQYYRSKGAASKDDDAMLESKIRAELNEAYDHDGMRGLALAVAKARQNDLVYLPVLMPNPQYSASKPVEGVPQYVVARDRYRRVVGNKKTIEEAKNAFIKAYGGTDALQQLEFAQIYGPNSYTQDIADDRKVQMHRRVDQNKAQISGE